MPHFLNDKGIKIYYIFVFFSFTSEAHWQNIINPELKNLWMKIIVDCNYIRNIFSILQMRWEPKVELAKKNVHTFMNTYLLSAIIKIILHGHEFKIICCNVWKIIPSEARLIFLNFFFLKIFSLDQGPFCGAIFLT